MLIYFVIITIILSFPTSPIGTPSQGCHYIYQQKIISRETSFCFQVPLQRRTQVALFFLMKLQSCCLKCQGEVDFTSGSYRYLYLKTWEEKKNGNGNGKLKARDKCVSLAFKKKKKKSPSARLIGTGIGKNIGTFLIMRTEEAFRVWEEDCL